MKNLTILTLLFLCSACLSFAQDITPVDVKFFDASCYNGKVTISQDPQIENFVETSVGLNKKRRGFYGYRVKVYAQNHQNARSQANAIRISIGGSGANEAYVTYVEPNFEVHVGNFRTRFDAVAALEKLVTQYPESYVIKTVISYPNLPK